MAAARSAIDDAKAEASAPEAKVRVRAIFADGLRRAKTLVPRFQLPFPRSH